MLDTPLILPQSARHAVADAVLIVSNNYNLKSCWLLLEVARMGRAVAWQPVIDPRQRARVPTADRPAHGPNVPTRGVRMLLHRDDQALRSTPTRTNVTAAAAAAAA